MARHNHCNVGGSRRRVGLFLSLAAAALVTALGTDAREQFGYVLNLHGDWVLDGSRHLKPGNTLPINGRVQVHDPQGGDFIEIVNRSGRVAITRSCDRGDCARVINLREYDPGVFSRLLGAAMALISNDPVQFAVLISRGTELKEAVVQITDEQVDLGPVLANKSKGAYLLRFDRRGGRSGAAKSVGPVKVDWDPDRPSVITVKGLTPGLYAALLLNNQDRLPLEPGTESWVLFTTPERFSKASRDFREAVDLTHSWGESARRSSKRQFLRATLARLNAEGH